MMNKSCYLTGKGLQKVQTALRELSQGRSEENYFKSVNTPFPQNVNLSQLEVTVGMQRETIRKILHTTAPVNRKSLYDLFSALSIDLEESDYESRCHSPKNATSSNQRARANTHKEPTGAVTQVVASDNGIPKVIRRSSQNRRNL